MSADMQFGDLEESGWDQHLRPDEDRHYAVVPCQRPRAGELKIYVDFDVMQEMEAHAQSDTRVELGGVLLGGQYEDAQGEPFVVVTDSLRANHYEATKGSFKFTHDTWQQISRDREDFAPDLKMVGWYHTHPDWGVFLSGMDLFICQHFFNRALDLALVIDPCRGDRGWFQWKSGLDQPQRTAGFYVIASRFRRDEIERWVEHLEGNLPMRSERSVSSHGDMPPWALGAWPPARMPVIELGLIGVLLVQCLLIGLLGWGLWHDRRDPQPNPALQASDASGSLTQANTPTALERAQAQILERLLVRDGADPDLATQWAEVQAERERLDWMLAEQQVASQQRQAQVQRLQSQLEQAQRQLESTEAARAEQVATNRELTTEVAALERQVRQQVERNREGYRWYQDELYWVALLGVALVCGLGGMSLATWWRRPMEEDSGQSDSAPPSPASDDPATSRGKETSHVGD